MENWELVIAIGPLDKDWLAAEIYYQGEQLAELTNFGKRMTLYPRSDGMPWSLDYDDVIAMLAEAYERVKEL